MSTNTKQSDSPAQDDSPNKDNAVVKKAKVQEDPKIVKPHVEANSPGNNLRGKADKQTALQPSGGFKATFEPHQMCEGEVCLCCASGFNIGCHLFIDTPKHAHAAVDEENQAFVSQRQRIGF